MEAADGVDVYTLVWPALMAGKAEELCALYRRPGCRSKRGLLGTIMHQLPASDTQLRPATAALLGEPALEGHAYSAFACASVLSALQLHAQHASARKASPCCAAGAQPHGEIRTMHPPLQQLCRPLLHTGEVGNTIILSAWGPACKPEVGSTVMFPSRSALEGLLRIARHEGPAVLWRGTDVSLMVAVPMVMLYFPLYETLLQRLQQSAGSANCTYPLVSYLCLKTVRRPFYESNMHTCRFDCGAAAGGVRRPARPGRSARHPCR